MPRFLRLIFLAIAATIISVNATAHPGGRDREGCHTCRTNCERHHVPTGERHCHGEHAALLARPPPSAPEILRLDYSGGFTVWTDGARRAAIRFRYNAQRDRGMSKRRSSFYLDTNAPPRCQQFSTRSYRRPAGAKPIYDRGHLVPANHMDQFDEAIRQTNLMTNILPQVAQMNRGAWKRTEDIVECYRDIDELLVIGGALWSDDRRRDDFVGSHGVRTPSQFWKVIIRGEDRVIAWLIPNDERATYRALDDYLVTVREIETLTGETMPIDEFRRDERPQRSWPIPIGCDRG